MSSPDPSGTGHPSPHPPNPDGRVVAVNIALLNAAQFAVRIDIHRDDTAAWPVTPATTRNTPP